MYEGGVHIWEVLRSRVSMFMMYEDDYSTTIHIKPWFLVFVAVYIRPRLPMLQPRCNGVDASHPRPTKLTEQPPSRGTHSLQPWNRKSDNLQRVRILQQARANLQRRRQGDWRLREHRQRHHLSEDKLKFPLHSLHLDFELQVGEIGHYFVAWE